MTEVQSATRSSHAAAEVGASDFAARALAYYLPQFHTIPENDEWWGKGFTEWTNTAKAKPLFPGHYQPHVPADLGFYDLRVPETREAQAAMARAYGVEGFIYWHYWFGDRRRILERPFNEVLTSGKPDFPFCLGWANETWSGRWHGNPHHVLMEQRYPGDDDYRRHFDFLLSAFMDKRYVRVEGKPLLLIYVPDEIPNCRKAMDFWRNLAVKAGLPGLHIIGTAWDDKFTAETYGMDAVTYSELDRPVGARRYLWQARLQDAVSGIPGVRTVANRWFKGPRSVYLYRDLLPHLVREEPQPYEYYPCVMPNWDNTPRSGMRGYVLHESSPELFREHLRQAIRRVSTLPAQRRILLVKSWNEWAEGNHLEPDLRYGHGFLRVLHEELTGKPSSATKGTV